MFNFIKGLFRSKKNEESCECGHCDTNIGGEASVTVTPTPKPKPKPKSKLTEEQRVQKVLKDFGMSISPKGIAAAEAAAKKAIEDKYPGMFIPGTRTAPGVRSR